MRRTLLIIAALSLLSTSAMAAATRNGHVVNGHIANGGKINGIDVGRTGVHTNTAQAVAGRLILR